jgi:hypothetical protein
MDKLEVQLSFNNFIDVLRRVRATLPKLFNIAGNARSSQ